MNNPSQRLAKGPEPYSSGAGSHVATRASDAETLLPAGIDPEDAAKRVLAVLAEGQYLAARRLAREAARRFPSHVRILEIAAIFDPRGKATVRPHGPRQPDREREFEWLRNPPEWARGKWVALVDGDVIAADESLEEVEKAVRSRKLPKRPLVHLVD